VRARKRFGQHFLSALWAERVVTAIGPRPEDDFLEIGPGSGALTRPLARQVRQITAIEIDRDLAAELEDDAPGNVRVVTADFLDADASQWLPAGTTARVAGNLPYNLTSPILFRLLDLAGDGRRISDATLMVQKEVAERLAAEPGTRDYGVLSICQQLRSRITLLLTLPPGAFRPAPKVHSAVVRITYLPPRVPLASFETFDRLVRSIFTQRRKTLHNALAPFASSRGQNAGELLARAGIDSRRRPETLDLAELGRLSDLFTSG
jgi:16S rRNA (adenine1518-N6/adenine1519-N6)-dimethyltransferase